MQTGFGVAHFVHQGFDPVESRRFEREHPLIVSEGKRFNGISADVSEVARGHAVLRKDPTALLGVHDVPVVRTDKRVNRDPVLWFLPHDEARQVGFVEFSWAVQAVTYPADLDQLPQRSGSPKRS